MIRILADQDDAFVETDDSCRPGRVLAGQPDMYGRWNMGYGELHGRAGVQYDRAFALQAEDFCSGQRNRRRNSVERGSAMPVQLDVAKKILRTRRHAVGQQ